MAVLVNVQLTFASGIVKVPDWLPAAGVGVTPVQASAVA